MGSLFGKGLVRCGALNPPEPWTGGMSRGAFELSSNIKTCRAMWVPEFQQCCGDPHPAMEHALELRASWECAPCIPALLLSSWISSWSTAPKPLAEGSCRSMVFTPACLNYLLCNCKEISASHLFLRDAVWICIPGTVSFCTRIFPLFSSDSRWL